MATCHCSCKLGFAPSSGLHLTKTWCLAVQFTIFLVSALFSVIRGVFSNLSNKNNNGGNKRDDWD